jgi:hypothetical protein
MSNSRPLVDCSAALIARSDKGLRRPVPWAEAEGVWFECPACNGGHVIAIYWRPRVGHTEARPGEALWRLEGGDSLANLTLSPSIHVRAGCDAQFHGWIKNGQVTW